tara:strand:- start:429 stop:722 length:294 start_codon:yes stop_codon:yes gene_type:complete
MQTVILVSLFLGWKISEAGFGPLFHTVPSCFGFLLAWAAGFSFFSGIREYLDQRYSRGADDGRSDEIRSLDLSGPFVGAFWFSAAYGVLYLFVHHYP